MQRILHRHIALPAYESVLKRRKVFRYLRELERSQWRSRDEIQQGQLESLRCLLTHAFDTCPYYHQTWQQLGLHPKDLQSLADFRRWPTIQRGDIAQHRMQMRTTAPGISLLPKSTGGSSGEPLRFDLTPESNDRRNAASFRGYGWAGADPGRKLLYLWGVPLGKQSFKSRCKESLYHRLYRRKILNCFELSEQRVPEFLQQHNAHRPDVLVAYTNALYEFARGIEQRGLRAYSPKSVVVGAEKLHDFQRTLIERVFGAPVFETYGSREFMLLAAECDRHEGLHLTHENLLVEILNEDGTPTPDGEEGNVVITDLFNYGMPFVRYYNGDRAVAGWRQCSCGRGLPLMQPVVGRRLDVLSTSDGRRVPGEFFPHLMKDFASVKRFQVVQDAPDHVELRVVASREWSDEVRGSIERASREVLGPACRLDLSRVDEIPLTGAGKLRVVVNLIGNSGERANAN